MFWSFLPAGLAFGILQVRLRFKNDAKLAHRLKNRDPHAISDLYDRYGRLAYSVIFRIVRDSATAEDLVQETFLRVWNRVHSFDPECGALGPWVLTVARHRAIDHLRSAAGRLPAGVRDLDRVEDPVLFSECDESALSLDRAQRLKAAFERLNPDQRAVIELACFEGLSETEMAQRLQQPLVTVKTWLRSALKALREELVERAIA